MTRRASYTIQRHGGPLGGWYVTARVGTSSSSWGAFSMTERGAHRKGSRAARKLLRRHAQAAGAETFEL